MRRLSLIGRIIVGLSAACFSTAALAAVISQGYAVISPIPVGALVSLSTTDAGTAVIADATNQKNLFGVVVTSSLLAISGSSGEVQVASSGLAPVLVSTEGGSIKRGDHLTVSTLAGVAKKATSSARSIGVADTDFDGTGSDAEKRKLVTSSGSHDIAIGQIPVDINVNNYQPGGLYSNSIVPAWLQSVTNNVAHKAVDPVRSLIALTIIIAAIISVSVLLYGAVRTSIISIGRNPLAKAAVFKGLVQIMGLVIIIMGVAVVLSYIVVSK